MYRDQRERQSIGGPREILSIGGAQMQSHVVRGVVADSRPIHRAGVSAILNQHLGMIVDGEVDTFAGLCEFLQAQERAARRIALLVLDGTLAGLPGLSGIRELRLRYPALRIAVMAAGRDRQSVLEALAAGAHGVLPRDLLGDELVAAFRTVTEGRIFVPSILEETASQPPAGARSPASRSAATEQLTDRQQDVIDLLVVGKSNKEIGRALRIAESTVKIHVSAAFRRLGVRNRIAAVSRVQALARRAPTDEPTLPGMFVERRRAL